MNYKGKVAVITGASQGIGAGMAEALLAEGMSLGVCARQIESSAPGALDCSAVIARNVDVRDAAGVDAFCQAVAERFGGIDLWINNAGVLEPIAPLVDINPDDFRTLLDINVMGVVHGAQTYIRHRRSHAGGGALINISSGAARKGSAGWSAYCASKAAVDRLSESVELEVANSGMRVYSVAPGVVDTHMQATIRATPEERFPNVAHFHDLKTNSHFNTPAFVANELLELAFAAPRKSDEVVQRVSNQWELAG